MSTITYKAGIMAGDTQVTDGNLKAGNVQKVHRLPDGRLAGCVGSLAVLQEFVRFLMDYGNGPNAVFPANARGSSDFDAIVVMPDGTAIEYSSSGGGYPTRMEAPFYAIGSGSRLAFGAMAVGATAVQALHVAMTYDICTGGQVMTVKLDSLTAKENEERLAKEAADADRKTANAELAQKLRERLSELDKVPGDTHPMGGEADGASRSEGYRERNAPPYREESHGTARPAYFGGAEPKNNSPNGSTPR